jgi:lactobin A/cerein 7B family class IIb bacteriocin
MRELSVDEVNQVNGGAVPIAAVFVKVVTWAATTAGAAAAFHYAKEFVSNS